MKILAVGAHLDDIEIACGGTLVKALQMGHQVKVLIMSKSGYTNIEGTIQCSDDVAVKAGTNALHVLESQNIEILDFSTKDIPFQSNVVNAIDVYMSVYNPDIIFTHHPFDTHQAHAGVSNATIAAARRRNAVFFYEPITPSGRSYVAFRPQLYVDIESTIDLKIASMREHKDVIPRVAEEIKIPLKKVGKLMLLSIVLAVLFCGLVVFAVGFVMTEQDIDGSLSSDGLVTADAMAKAFSSGIMAKILIIGGICGIVTSWNSFMIGGRRTLFSMADAHMIPGILGKLHEKYMTLKNALMFIVLLSMASLFLGRSALVWISDTASLACCIAYCIVAASFLTLRKKETSLERHYKIVGLMATMMTAVMVLLYLIPGSECTLTSQE